MRTIKRLITVVVACIIVLSDITNLLLSVAMDLSESMKRAVNQCVSVLNKRTMKIVIVKCEIAVKTVENFSQLFNCPVSMLFMNLFRFFKFIYFYVFIYFSVRIKMNNFKMPEV